MPADYVRAVSRGGRRAAVRSARFVVAARRSTWSTVSCSPAARISIRRCTAQRRIAETSGVIRERDDFELELMRAALERDVPMLAICRGSQVLNVALGGDLEQHVPDRVGTELASRGAGRVLGARRRGRRAARGSASILGDRHDVKSHHHQGFGALGDGPARSRPRPGRNAGSAGGPNAPLHPGRPVASGSGRGPGAVRSAGRGGQGFPRLVPSRTT